MNEADYNRLGFVRDRNWLVVTDKNEFHTQRQTPKMALIKPSFDEKSGSLCLDAPECKTLKVPLTLSKKLPVVEVKVWKEMIKARECGTEAAKWLTAYLGVETKLVSILGAGVGEHERPLPAKYKPDEAAGTNVMAPFSDVLPFLVSSCVHNFFKFD